MATKKSLDTSISFYTKFNNTRTFSREEELNLIKEAQQGNMVSRNKLITNNLPFVVSTVRNYAGEDASIGDLVSEGVFGLAIAINKFDTTKGYRLITYARLWIIQSVQRALINKCGVKLTERESKALSIKSIGLEVTDSNGDSANILDVPEVRCQYDEQNLTPEDEYMKKAMNDDIKSFINVLDKREKYIITRRFGLDGEEKETLCDVGKRINMSREQVFWYESKALRTLRKNATTSKKLSGWV